jgi:hypothetical protein
MRKVPPKSRETLWKDYLRLVLGIPLIILVGALVIAGFLWLSGGETTWRVSNDMGTAIMYMGLIVLIYPVILVIWTLELRSGLRDLRDWDSMTPDARAAALAAAKPQRKRRRTSVETKA